MVNSGYIKVSDVTSDESQRHKDIFKAWLANILIFPADWGHYQNGAVIIKLVHKESNCFNS